MKKLILLLAGACACRLFAAELTSEEQTWLKNHPVIRIAPDPEFPPIEWIDEDGTYRGITSEFMKLIEDQLGITFQVVRCKDWDEVLQKARDRKVDLLPAAAQTPERAEYMLFSEPHMAFPGVIITTTKNSSLDTTEELYGKRVGIVSGYVWDEFIREQHPAIRIVEVRNVIEGLRRVATGDIDAFIGTLPIVIYYIEQEGIHNLVVAGQTEYETRLSILTRKDWPVLNDIIRKTLASIPETRKKEIIQKWITLQPSSIFRQKAFWIILASVLGVVALGILMVLLWNISLKKQVAVQTAALEESRERIRQDLREKEILLQELYHRTKNNMQVIIAMLSIQAREHTDSELSRLFREVIDKIHSMSMVHQKLYEAESLSNIDLREYIIDLTQHLRQSYQMVGPETTLDIDVCEAPVTIDTAVPLGLILTELISNIFKHAFPGGRKGNITIFLQKNRNGEFVLIVADDGVGISSDSELHSGGSLGLESVYNMVQHQLNGTISYVSQQGLQWRITFPLNT